MVISEEVENNWIPFSWVFPVIFVSWKDLEKSCTLDAYFFMRFINLCFWLTAVPAFWSAFLLWPVYSTASGDQKGFYQPSILNVTKASDDDSLWRLWFPGTSRYFFHDS